MPITVTAHAHGVPAQEMTKWFDTNYHYMVPELRKGPDNSPSPRASRSRNIGRPRRWAIRPGPVLLGPVTFLKLAKSKDAGFDPLSLLDRLLPVYIEVLRELAADGAEWVQIDEPCLVLDLDATRSRRCVTPMRTSPRRVPQLKIMLATYFGGLGDNLDTALALARRRACTSISSARRSNSTTSCRRRRRICVLSLGVIDGRNIWRADLRRDARSARAGRREARQRIACRSRRPARCCMSRSISTLETGLDPDVKSWLAFSVQKIEELATLGNGARRRPRSGRRTRWRPPTTQPPRARRRPKSTMPRWPQRVAAHRRRRCAAATARSPSAPTFSTQRFNLPAFPTTTIGSFPQTAEVRNARAAHAKGALSDAAYKTFLQNETARAVRWQEEIGLDVLVHGEFERNDMVQYFGEQLAGFAFTKHGWVQSYGSRYVRPPILFGDVSRPEADDGRMVAIRAVADQEADEGDADRAGDHPQLVVRARRHSAQRGLPADRARDPRRGRRSRSGRRRHDPDRRGGAAGRACRCASREWQAYLDWAVESFRLCSSGVRDETQIHTHMCYSEFNDIIDAIGAMDADVISIETSRSKMELLDAFRNYDYPNEIGPGVYDIHSPRVPEIGEMTDLLKLARQRLSDAQIWINPDCGLKTRKWEEVRPALVNMVAAARELRALA